MLAELNFASISFYPDLKTGLEVFYNSCGLQIKQISVNTESKEYGACSFSLNETKIIHRVSKITPTKTGQFVTLWKRNKAGITQALDIEDDFDVVIITSKLGENIGQFIFPKSVLANNGVITKKSKKGKLGIRVYPPWDQVTSNQAKKTQTWQMNYFLTFQNAEGNGQQIKQKLIESLLKG